MTYQNEYLDKYLEEATIQDLVHKYMQEGYEVHRDVRIGSYMCDLVAQKQGKSVYIEVVARDGKKGAVKDKVVQLHKAVKSIQNAEFRVVFVSHPKETQVEINGIEDILCERLINDIPEELTHLATHVSIEDVSDVEIDHVYIEPNQIHISGSFVVSVILQYGSNLDVKNDLGMEVQESFPGKFQATLDGELNVDEINFDIDVSSWDE